MNDERSFQVEEVDAVAPPPRARVEDAEPLLPVALPPVAGAVLPLATGPMAVQLLSSRYLRRVGHCGRSWPLIGSTDMK